MKIKFLFCSHNISLLERDGPVLNRMSVMVWCTGAYQVACERNKSAFEVFVY
jgi:hypothetical protein